MTLGALLRAVASSLEEEGARFTAADAVPSRATTGQFQRPVIGVPEGSCQLAHGKGNRCAIPATGSCSISLLLHIHAKGPQQASSARCWRRLWSRALPLRLPGALSSRHSGGVVAVRRRGSHCSCWQGRSSGSSGCETRCGARASSQGPLGRRWNPSGVAEAVRSEQAGGWLPRLCLSRQPRLERLRRRRQLLLQGLPPLAFACQVRTRISQTFAPGRIGSRNLAPSAPHTREVAADVTAAISIMRKVAWI